MRRLLLWSLPVLLVAAGGLFLLLRPRPADRVQGGPAETAGRTAEGQTASRPHRTPVLILAIDTLRGDHLHCMGLDWLRTPFVDALAADGVLFASCQSTCPWTGPSFASIFTGLVPYHHGFYQREPGGLPAARQTIAEILSRQGYTTAAYVTISYLTEVFGMDQGFQVGRKFADEADGEAAKLVTWNGQRFLDEIGQDPFLLFLHYYDVHSPYTPPPPFDGLYYQGDARGPGRPLLEFLTSDANPLLEDRADIYAWLEGVTDPRYPPLQYAACVSYVDAHVGAVLDHLRQTGLYDETLVILLADHGEHLGEHGIYYAHALPYQETLHVPLIIKWPGSLHARLVVQQRVSTLDVLPTVLEILGLPIPTGLDGHSLVGLVQDAGAGNPPADARSLLLSEEGDQPDRWSKALVEGNWKLLVFADHGSQRQELYDLAADPGETHDLAPSRPEIAAGLAEHLWRICDPAHPLSAEESAPATRQLSEEERRRLRALGYVR
jgi:arylsulfatase